MKKIKKVLIANRGEIALRVIRACREMGIQSVAVYSEADRNSLHVLQSDEAHCIGPPPSGQSYLNIDSIIHAARTSGSDAIHPGYGFLAENSDFPRACERAGIIFIGPTAESMAVMGDKTEARKKVEKAGVPAIPGTNRSLDSLREMEEVARDIGYPVLIKAALGGGGKGMRVCLQPGDLESHFTLCRKESQAAFGSPKLFLEKYLAKPRHIEFQILADHFGKTIHLGERECSIQRRHQKLIEESPSVAIDDKLRKKMGEAAVAAARAVEYRNAGTVEFLLDAGGHFYFLEMNTRLQVEHPVTEMVTGVDLVKQQLRIAEDRQLALKQSDVMQTGHAIEGRIYAEDPASSFMPSSGVIQRLIEPGGPGIRLDSGVYQGVEVGLHYDPIISKLLAWGATRNEAIRRMERALKEYTIRGIRTTIPFLQMVMQNRRFHSGEFDTHFIEETGLTVAEPSDRDTRAAGIAAVIIEQHFREFRRSQMKKGGEQGINPWKWAGRKEGAS